MSHFANFFLHASEEEKIKVFTEAANKANQEQRRYMYTGISELYKYHIIYCEFKAMYDDCKWWQFTKKRMLKRQLDYISPLMRNEVKLILKGDMC